MNTEKLVKTNIDALGEIVKEYAGEKDFERFKSQMQDWDSLWEELKKWLMETPVTDRDETIMYFIKQHVPCYREIWDRIQLSLSLHDEFWTEFFLNMVKAKTQLAR